MSATSRTDLRDALLGAETPSPELERRYRERLAGLFVHRLNTVQKGSIVAVLVVSLWLVVRFIQLFVESRTGTPLVTIVSLAVGLAFSAGMVALSVWLLRGGVEDFRRHTALRTQLVVLFTFALALLMLWAGIETKDSASSMRLILFGLVFWTTIGLPFFLMHHIRQSELRLRAQLLRMELELAQAAERKESAS